MIAIQILSIHNTKMGTQAETTLSLLLLPGYWYEVGCNVSDITVLLPNVVTELLGIQAGVLTFSHTPPHDRLTC